MKAGEEVVITSTDKAEGTMLCDYTEKCAARIRSAARESIKSQEKLKN